MNAWSLLFFGVALPLCVLQRMEARARRLFAENTAGGSPARPPPGGSLDTRPLVFKPRLPLATAALELYLFSCLAWAATCGLLAMWQP